jgi:phosphohistidine swiveling domain-containing protein
MEMLIQPLDRLPVDQQHLAGGKAATLARLAQAGYPVPQGFVIPPVAFAGEALRPEAWAQIEGQLATMRASAQGAAFVVRSSALHEDSAQASFAGEFETVLNVATDTEILAAIGTVRRSGQSERVQAYSAAQGIAPAHQLAVLIQMMVPAELAGVLFTADPVTGSHAQMIGNYVHGLGEQLVSGSANADAFTIARPKGSYDGPQEFKRYAARLYRLAGRLEKELGSPQDIEWAVAGGKLHLLQARPITTLTLGDLDTYAINESLAEDAIWINTNVGEAVPDVFSPLTWSIIRGFDDELNLIPGYYVWSGNICGRVYSNISRRVSAIAAILGIDGRRAMKLLGDLFGSLPEGMDIPVQPFTRLELMRVVLPRVKRILQKMLKASRTLQPFLQQTPDWCRTMTARIRSAQTQAELLQLWQQELQPYTIRAWWAQAAGGSGIVKSMMLERKLTKRVGTEDANALLSNLRGAGELASLGPVVGISKIVKGEMSREDYLARYGHRGPHEFELSIPHPAEDASWLERQIAEHTASDADVEQLLERQRTQYEAARKHFQARFPKKVAWLDRQIAKISEGARLREVARSEFTRVFRVVRAFALKAGELTSVGADVFFLYRAEVLDLLAGSDAAVRHIPARKANYERYQALPPFPSVIRGRFNPFEWESDPHRRSDYYDATMPAVVSDSDFLKGVAGAAGRIEGRVRILLHPEEGAALQPGEILVATTTNVGWTPLFPRAAAIITDIGAPLSHAAIVARELGIPAVVGCGNATMRLQTGDRVLVDGGQGLVEILEQVE